jgi:hypothetical protein
MQLIDSIGQAPKLLHYLFDEAWIETWAGEVLPEIPKAASICPLKHEIAFSSFREGGNALDDIWMVETTNLI